MEESIKKTYLIEVLYDNGTTETYSSGAVTEEEFFDLINVVYLAFQNGANGVLQLPPSTLINIGKVTCVNWKEAPENN